MGLKQHGRQYDVIVLGATGYTGLLTAEHIAAHLPTNLKWAVAGRTESKLRGIVDTCHKINADRVPPSIEIADASDEKQLRALAEKAFVVITTVGPYCLYGEPVLKACVETGTHYLDCTGEVPWVARMVKKYEALARKSGAMIFPQCGFESAPPDLLTWSMTQYLQKQMSAQAKEVYVTIHKIIGAPSGGTLATVLAYFDVFPLKEIQAASAPYASSPIPHPKGGRPATSIAEALLGVCSLPNLGLVTTSAAGMTDRAVIERSWGLLHEIPSRKKEFYGPNFTWKEYFKARNWFHGVLVHWGLMIGALFLALVPPVRSVVKRFVFKPGEGVSREDMAKEEIEFRGTANPDLPSNAAKKQAFCRAWYHAGAYPLTAALLAEGALTMLEDDLQLDGGCYTAACMGQKYIDRLDGIGFKLTVNTIEG